jgi:hypothetical protein
MSATVSIGAELPEELLREFLQHLRDFDTQHHGEVHLAIWISPTWAPSQRANPKPNGGWMLWKMAATRSAERVGASKEQACGGLHPLSASSANMAEGKRAAHKSVE